MAITFIDKTITADGNVTSHTHPISDVTGLQSSLDAKMDEPAGGSDGQVLTLSSGIPQWANPGSGGSAVSPSLRTVISSSTFDSTDYTILVNTSGGNVTITIDAMASGRVGFIKKISSDVNKVTLVPSSGTIDGFPSYELDGYNEVIQFQSNGTHLYILNK